MSLDGEAVTGAKKSVTSNTGSTPDPSESFHHFDPLGSGGEPLMIHLFTFIIWAYVLWRFVLPLPVREGLKWLLASVLLLVSQHHLVSRNFFGTLASPELPFEVLVVLGCLFGTLILLAIFLLIKDLGTIILRLLRRAGIGLALPFSASFTPAILLGSALLLSGFGVWQAVRVPDVRTVEVVLPRLPAALDGLRIVQLSDLHASRLFQEPWVRAVVAKSNALTPDLTLVTGDLIDGTPEDRAGDVSPLRELKARLGVFAIPGNHEYYANHPEWLSVFADLGLRMLLNEHVLITEKNHPLVIAGVTDRTAARIGAAMPDIKAALSGAPAAVTTILMEHQPRAARINASADVDLQLSGHTHGGQILGMHFITQYANGGFVSGLYPVGDMQLYVSNGAGLWPGFPVRLGLPSEIVQFVLRASPDKKIGAAS